MRQWNFDADMNHDGIVTISDVFLWFQWLYFYPGDFLLNILIGTDIGQFLELSPRDFGRIGSGVVSFVIWGFAILMAMGLREQWKMPRNRFMPPEDQGEDS